MADYDTAIRINPNDAFLYVQRSAADVRIALKLAKQGKNLALQADAEDLLRRLRDME